MAKVKARGEELSPMGEQTMPRAYSAMDYYFDHLKKTVVSAPSGGTEFGEKVKACGIHQRCHPSTVMTFRWRHCDEFRGGKNAGRSIISPRRFGEASVFRTE
jgi:hypothetical protein